MADQEQDEAPPRPLRDQIEQVISAFDNDRMRADGVMHLLQETGHVLLGAPEARVILADAQQFAGQLILSNLAIRIIRMTIMTGIETPESKATERFIRDYCDGRNHGPVGKPMLWPGTLPGLAALLRQWEFEPTETKPAYVRRKTRDLTSIEIPDVVN